MITTTAERRFLCFKVVVNHLWGWCVGFKEIFSTVSRLSTPPPLLWLLLAEVMLQVEFLKLLVSGCGWQFHLTFSFSHSAVYVFSIETIRPLNTECYTVYVQPLGAWLGSDNCSKCSNRCSTLWLEKCVFLLFTAAAFHLKVSLLAL